MPKQCHNKPLTSLRPNTVLCQCKWDVYCSGHKMSGNVCAISYLKNKTKSLFINLKSPAQFDSTELADAVQIAFVVCTQCT